MILYRCVGLSELLALQRDGRVNNFKDYSSLGYKSTSKGFCAFAKNSHGFSYREMMSVLPNNRYVGYIVLSIPHPKKSRGEYARPVVRDEDYDFVDVFSFVSPSSAIFDEYNFNSYTVQDVKEIRIGDMNLITDDGYRFRCFAPKRLSSAIYEAKYQRAEKKKEERLYYKKSRAL